MSEWDKGYEEGLKTGRGQGSVRMLSDVVVMLREQVACLESQIPDQPCQAEKDMLAFGAAAMERQSGDFQALVDEMKAAGVGKEVGL